MITKGVSHIAIGVRDMDRSLSFYRDILGFKVIRDEIQKTAGSVLPALYQDTHTQRRVTTLHWDNSPDAAFLVLSEHSDKPVTGEPIKLDQIGVHHFAFWVEDLPAVYEELKNKGAEFIVGPSLVANGTFNSAFISDPDGIIIQLDERVSQ
ncbi:MAG: VOC family protein [Pseudomonadales bacterium]|nr:VOC family protein [Pseudomonadales bacterium]